MPWFGWLRRNQSAGTQLIESMALQDGTPIALMGGRMRTIGLPYALPRDMEEINRLDFQHYMLRYALRGLYAAPLDSPTAIIDVGTGTGRWAMDMAQQFPLTRIIGVDVNPPPADSLAQTGLDMRPPNYNFAPGNVLEGLPFSDGAFDFSHMRLLFTAIPSDRWPLAIRELARVTRPGGWAESVETTGLHNGGPNVDRMMGWITQMSARRQVDLANGSRVIEFMHMAGLRNVAGSVVNVPTGVWGDRLGNMVATDFIGVCTGYAGLLVGAGLTSQQEFDQTLEGMRNDFNTRRYRCFTPFYVVIGQR